MLEWGKLRRVALAIASLFVLSIFSGTAIAQESIWTDTAASVGPSPRAGHDMAYDAESDRIILFGGTGEYERDQKDDTWAYNFNANTWTNLRPSNGPSPRGGHTMAYDGESDRVILFGGDIAGPQTWAFDYDGNVWTNMSPVIQPTAWYIADMAYDAESDRIVLLGGCAESKYAPCDPVVSDETWSYDYNSNTWTNLNPDTSPGDRIDHRLAYDSESDVVILFGGETARDQDDETWAFDFNTNRWTMMTPAVRPVPRCCHAMAYDASTDRVVIFGGWTPATLDDTWMYDFNEDTWIRTGSGRGPPPRAVARVAYDSESERVILFGGWTGPLTDVVELDDTWALEPAPVDWPLVYVVLGVVAAAVVAVVAVFLARRRSRMQEGREGR